MAYVQPRMRPCSDGSPDYNWDTRGNVGNVQPLLGLGNIADRNNLYPV